MTTQLKAKKELTAEVVIDFGDYKAELMNCRVFANEKTDSDIVFIAQDVNDPTKKVQITIKKVDVPNYEQLM